MKIDDINYAQRQRLKYIDFCLLFQGHISRLELLQKFEVGLSAATRDFNEYKQHCPNNLNYDNANKRYYQTATFTPLFEHDARTTLIKLANKISEGSDPVGDIQFPVEAPSQLNVPNLFIVAKLIQAIINQQAVSIIYTSLSSGSGARELVPHAIVDNGLRWHVRAFDRKTNSFRDFVLTRISKVSLLNDEPQHFEQKDEDHQWQRVMKIQLIPHPKNIQHPTAIELDYAMENGVLEIDVRAAMAGYLLRRWNVDCTENASLKGGEYQLWLRNFQTLYGAENLAIAPGYKID